MRIPQNKYQPPFQNKNLVSLISFKNLCSKSDIRITDKDILLLWNKGIFFPAKRVYSHGFPMRRILINKKDKDEWVYVDSDKIEEFEYKDINPQIYYQRGGTYFENKKGGPYRKGTHGTLTTYPSAEKVKPVWEKRTKDYQTSVEAFEEDNDLFFDKTQILVIKTIFDSTSKYPKQYLNHSRLENKNEVLKLKKEVVRINRFLKFYLELSDLMSDLTKDILKIEKELKEKHPDMEWKDLEDDYPGAHSLKLRTKRPVLQELMKKHEIAKKDLDDWRNFLTEKSSIKREINDSDKAKNELKKMSNYDLYHKDYIHAMIYELNNAWLVLTGKRVEIKSVLLGIGEDRICKICKVSFHPCRRAQMTCGKKECVNKHRNAAKREKRKIKKSSKK